MDLKYLNTFRVIAEEGSFTRAAERLGYTQSTMTFQMGQLEQALSARLFEKVGRRMVLSQAGRQLLPYVERVLEAVNQMHCFTQDLTQCRGEITIGVAETLLCYRLPPLLKAFHRRAPQARLLIRSMGCYDIRDGLMDGSLDVGLFYENIGGLSSQLVTHPVGTFPVVLTAAPQVKALGPDFVAPDHQVPLPFLINEPNSIFRQMFEGYLRERAIRMDHTIELGSIPTIKHLVENEVGVTFLPRFAVEDALAAGRLVELETGMEEPVLSTEGESTAGSRSKRPLRSGQPEAPARLPQTTTHRPFSHGVYPCFPTPFPATQGPTPAVHQARRRHTCRFSSAGGRIL